MKTSILASICMLAAAAFCSAQVTMTEFPLPSAGSYPYGVTRGPDGNLWFTEVGPEDHISASTGNRIGRITPDGLITEYPLPAGNIWRNCGRCPIEITTGPDGNLWFTEYGWGQVGRITPTGVLTEFFVPTVNSFPYGIAAGPDGNLWFTETGVADGGIGPIGGNKIGRITPGGVITEFTIPTPRSDPREIVVGPDGNLWFTEEDANQIGRITLAGVITEYPVPFGSGCLSSPFQCALSITAGPDGNLWFADYALSNIGKISVSGAIQQYPVGSLGVGYTGGITTGPDNNLWFTVNRGGADQIVKLTPAGAVTPFVIPTAGGLPAGIISGPDHRLWFTEFVGNKIGAASLGPLYRVCLLYDSTRAVHAGSTLPIKLQLCDDNGTDVSSESITLHATTVTSTLMTVPANGSGHANPENNFRFDITLGSTGGYILNLSTEGLPRGTYNLSFTVTGDSSVYAAPFQIR